MQKRATALNRTQASAGKILYGVLHYLAENGGSARKDKIIKALPNQVDLDAWELEITGKHRQPRWLARLWYTIDAVKAGWLVKERGTWRITPEGEEKLSLSSDELVADAMAAYARWTATEKTSGKRKDTAAFADRAAVMQSLLRTAAQAPAQTMQQGDLVRIGAQNVPGDVADSLAKKSEDWAETVATRVLRRAARVGWFDRVKREWTLTETGNSAFEEWSDPLDLLTTMRALLDDDNSTEQVIPYHGPVEDRSATPQALYGAQQLSIQGLVDTIDSGALALPDIQRPFVWKNTKVRDLLDSMFRGFPFGYFLTWKNPSAEGVHSIGIEPKGQNVPHALVIDGQQRLTSLFAVFTGKEVLDNKFKRRRIKIAFHPLRAKFEVSDAAIAKNAEWLADITPIFADPRGPYGIAEDYLARLEKVRELEDEHRNVVRLNLTRLGNLKNMQVQVLQISADAGEEEVADVFVRINSKGQNLRQADFILTLLAVYWEEGREQLEGFAQSCVRLEGERTVSPYNDLLHPGPDDMIRPIVALGHGRARLSSAYQILRGKDPVAGVVDTHVRDENFAKFKGAQEVALSIRNWHEFLKCLSAAGYVNKKLIWSKVTSLYAYAFYLLGCSRFGMEASSLRKLIARWFIMSTVTSRFVGGSSESVMEEDLARLRGLHDGDSAGFQQVLEGIMATELTDDFWGVTLPSRLESSSSRTPSSFFAAQCVMNAPALFSTLSVAELLSPTRASTKEHLEVHHLFPKAWLQRNGFDAPRLYNQAANMSLLEWPDNIKVSDQAVAKYVPELRVRFTDEDLARMDDLHALPEEWWAMSYPDFLKARRALMAQVIRRSFDKLA
jgi:hypothetical protein